MKKIMKDLGVFSCSLLALSLFAGAAAFAEPTIVTVRPEKAYVPPGFDDNDNAQFTITGTYVNTCYRTAAPVATVDPIAHKIRVKDQAYFFGDSLCLMMLVGYSQTIELGTVPAGTYDIYSQDELGGETKLSTMTVATATTTSADENVYANIADANVADAASNPGWKELKLSGTLPSDCLELKEISVLYRTSNVIEVLPIASVKEGVICQAAPRPFAATVLLKDTWKGTTLIHIRSLSGKAINKLVDF